MNVSNALRDIFMVVLITCNGIHFRKKQTQSFLSTDADWAHMSRNTSFKFKGQCDVGKSFHRCVESASTVHCIELW